MAEVKDFHRTAFPYQCIGKLQYSKRQEHFTGTAFAVNVKGAKNIIFTSATNLEDEKGRAAMIEFIPAMKNDGSQPYGSFKQVNGGKGVAWFVHPNWDPTTKPHAFNLGAIKLGTNQKGKDVGDVLRPLDVDFDVMLNHDTQWNIIWYSQLRMFESTAATFTETIHNGKSVVVSHDSMKIPSEASGAPWLLSSSQEVNGHFVHIPGYKVESALSPYYNLGLIRELLNQM